MQRTHVTERLQGQDHSAVTTASGSSHARCCLIRLSCDNDRTHYTESQPKYRLRFHNGRSAGLITDIGGDEGGLTMAIAVIPDIAGAGRRGQRPSSCCGESYDYDWWNLRKYVTHPPTTMPPYSDCSYQIIRHDVTVCVWVCECVGVYH
ncbi:hypothetical protein J6590_045779 [Homalodisca vitripennis]|nr:hypothetical protein J6590_045779 [Homalodisca vitripennis]